MSLTGAICQQKKQKGFIEYKKLLIKGLKIEYTYYLSLFVMPEVLSRASIAFKTWIPA